MAGTVGKTIQDLLSVWHFTHDMAGEMAEMESVMLKSDFRKGTFLFRTARSQKGEVISWMLIIGDVYNCKERELAKSV